MVPFFFFFFLTFQLLNPPKISIASVRIRVYLSTRHFEFMMDFLCLQGLDLPPLARLQTYILIDSVICIATTVTSLLQLYSQVVEPTPPREFSARNCPGCVCALLLAHVL